MKLFTQIISLLLSPILAVGPLSASPAESPGAAAGSAAAQQIEIHVLRGDNNAAQIGSVAKSAILVEVTDATGAKVQDAAIAFRLPDSGATGTFGDGTRAAVAYTDKSGQAILGEIRWGTTAGTVPIRVTASKGSSHAGLVVEQTLMATGTAPAILSHPILSAPAVQVSTPEVIAPINAQPAAPSVPAPQSSVPAAAPSVRASQPSIAHVSATASSTSDEPRVSIASDSVASKHGRKGKWIAILAVAAGAAAGLGMAGHGKSSSTASTPGLSVGAPTISVGSH